MENWAKAYNCAEFVLQIQILSCIITVRINNLLKVRYFYDIIG